MKESRKSEISAVKDSQILNVSEDAWGKAKQELSSHIEEVINDKILFSSVGGTYKDIRFDKLSMKRVNIVQGIFDKCSFFKVAGTGSELRDCKFLDCDFTGSNFQFASFEESEFASTVKNNPSKRFEKTLIAGANFSATNFTRSKLDSIAVEGSSFHASYFSGAQISDCQISSSTFEGAIFENATLQNLDLGNINIEYADFTNANFKGVIAPIMQLPYTFNGLQQLFSGADIKIQTKNESFSNKLLTKDEYVKLLPSLEIYFIKMQEYFPLANIYLATDRINLFNEAIELGIKVAIAQRQIRNLKFYSKLALLSNRYTLKELTNLYKVIKASILKSSSDPLLMHQYSIHSGEIEQYLVSNSQNNIYVHFVTKQLDLLSAQPLLEVISEIDRMIKVSNLSVELRSVNASKNSPADIILEFFSKHAGNASIFLIAVGYLLKGSAPMLEQIMKMLDKKDEKENEQLRKQLKAMKKQVANLRLDMSNIDIYMKSNNPKMIAQRAGQKSNL